MNTTQLMHVSPDMIDQEDMKNWNPEQWTRHLQEQVDLPRVNCHVYIMMRYYQILVKQTCQFQLSPCHSATTVTIFILNQCTLQQL